MKTLQDDMRTLGRSIRALTLVILTLSTLLFTAVLNPSLFDFLRKKPKVWELKDPKLAYESGVMSRDVQYGYLLLTETYKWMGPLAEEPEMRLSGNKLACTNCHLAAGTQAGSASWVGVADRFPQFGARSNSEGTLEDRINGCMERSMNGQKLDPDSKPMQAMIAYMEWLGEDLPKEKKKYFEGFTSLKLPNEAVDLAKGKEVYDRECVVCHGSNGEGAPRADGGYLYPPLWGTDTYNDGAGMHRVITAAEFIKANMPYLIATKENPKLTDEEAYHVAGYINSFDRPKKSNLETDYPDKKLKPVSTPYGPWTDTFPPEQHKYGPFPPIIDWYRETYQLNKTK